MALQIIYSTFNRLEQALIYFGFVSCNSFFLLHLIVLPSVDNISESIIVCQGPIPKYVKALSQRFSLSLSIGAQLFCPSQGHRGCPLTWQCPKTEYLFKNEAAINCRKAVRIGTGNHLNIIKTVLWVSALPGCQSISSRTSPSCSARTARRLPRSGPPPRRFRASHSSGPPSLGLS